jgi:hypothetical protein
LPGLEAAVGFIDHIDTALAPHDTAIAMAFLNRFQRVNDFHLGLARSRRQLATVAFNKKITAPERPEVRGT